MKTSKFAAIGIGACAAACAGSLAVPALIGAGALGLGGVAFDVKSELLVCLGGGVLVAGGLLLLWRRRSAQAPSCAANGACGCNPAKADAIGQQ